MALVLPAACRRGEPPRPAAAAVEPGLRQPESALWDSAGGVWLVSNVSGSPLARDDDGFISRLDVMGRPVLWRWIDGADTAVALNAPKGMAIKGDTLFVADIDVVRLFHRVTGPADRRARRARARPSSTTSPSARTARST